MNPRYVILISLVFYSYLLQADNHALLIGIGDYPTDSGWRSLSSQNDIDHIYASLQSIGFDESRMTVLQDANATKAGILEAFKSLEASLHKGDFLYIHYSGHGQQMVDKNGDEIDKLDECIVPYDSPLKYIPGEYEGENLITDDDLDRLTRKLRHKIGKKGKLILVLDSCHSGTGSRGSGIARGTDIIMSSTNVAGSAQVEQYGITNSNDNSLASLVCYFGASAQELNYETYDDNYQSIGSLSLAISKGIQSMELPITASKLFRYIKLSMLNTSPEQSPLMEGPKEVSLFDNKNLSNSKVAEVVEVIGDNIVVINKGQINGVYAGSLLTITFNGTTIYGEVTKSTLVESLVQVNQNLAREDIDNIEIVKIKTSIPNTILNVSTNIQDNDLEKMVRKQLLNLPYINITEENVDRVITQCGENTLQLGDQYGDVYGSFTTSEEDLEKLEAALFSNLKISSLRKTNYSSEDLKMELVISPVKVDNNNNIQSTIPLSQMMDEYGLINLKVGTYLQVSITNRGSKPGYVSLIDIQPDDKVNMLIPNPKQAYSPADYYLEPGQSLTLNYLIKIYPPLGHELFKLIVTDKPIDLYEMILSSNDTRSNSINFLNLFNQSSSRSTETSITKISTDDFPFLIYN